MGLFYLEVNNETWEMDSTSSVVQDIRGSLSNSRVEDGSSVSDNYVTDPITVSFSGTISDIKALSNGAAFFNIESRQKTTQEFLSTLRQVYINKQPISVAVGAESEFLRNCFFTSFNISQDSKNGSSSANGRILSSYKLSFTLQQVRFAKRATVVRAPAEIIQDNSAEQKERNTSVADSCGGDESNRLLCEAEETLTILKAGR